MGEKVFGLSALLPTKIISIQSLVPNGQSRIYGGRKEGTLYIRWEHKDDKQ